MVKYLSRYVALVIIGNPDKIQSGSGRYSLWTDYIEYWVNFMEILDYAFMVA